MSCELRLVFAYHRIYNTCYHTSKADGRQKRGCSCISGRSADQRISRAADQQSSSQAMQVSSLADQQISSLPTDKTAKNWLMPSPKYADILL